MKEQAVLLQLIMNFWNKMNYKNMDSLLMLLQNLLSRLTNMLCAKNICF